MSRLPRVTAAQIIRVLEKIGFSLVRQSGSHKIYKSSQGKRITIPYHKGKILHPKLLKRVLQDAELTTATLKKLLK